MFQWADLRPTKGTPKEKGPGDAPGSTHAYDTRYMYVSCISGAYMGGFCTSVVERTQGGEVLGPSAHSQEVWLGVKVGDTVRTRPQAGSPWTPPCTNTST